MSRHIRFTGSAEKQSKQKHAIYTDPNAFPTDLTWKIELKELRTSPEEFLENLFFSTERNGGNSYFYPNHEKGFTHCRYEWHHPWRRRAAQIRLGLVLEVEQQGFPHQATAYIGTNQGYLNHDSENDPKKISHQKVTEYKKKIQEEIERANSPRHDMPEESWQFIHYATGGPGYWSKPFFASPGKTLLLPPRLVNGATLFGTVIKESGITRGDASRKAMKEFHLTLAMLTLATGCLWEAHYSEVLPRFATGKLSTKSGINSKIFPNGSTDAIERNKIDMKVLSFVRLLMQKIEITDTVKSEKIMSSLFGYYGALIASKHTPSLAAVGFTAAIGVLAADRRQQCDGKITCSDCGPIDLRHNLVGDRAAIADMASESFQKLFGSDFVRNAEFDSWTKQVYNSIRSQYAHSARHLFNEFSQVFGGSSSSTTAVPTAIPSNGKLVRRENEYRLLSEYLPQVARISLIANIVDGAKLTRLAQRLRLRQPDFSDVYIQEAFLGMPTSGWVRAM